MPKLGDALKKAVEVKPREREVSESRARPSSPLMNANRRAVFQYLCNRPCARAGEIASELELSRSSVKWHLKVLEESGYVESFQDGKVPAFCPSGMVSRKAMSIYSILGVKECMNVFTAILGEPGSDSAALEEELEMSRQNLAPCIRRMLDARLISAVKDGRHLRYYPTEELRRTMIEEKGNRKEFIRSVVKRLGEEHLRPEVEELKGRGIVISIRIVSQNVKITIPEHSIFSFYTTE